MGRNLREAQHELRGRFNVENGILERLSLGTIPQRLRGGSPGDGERLGVEFGGLCFILSMVLMEVSKVEGGCLQGSSENQAFLAQAKGPQSQMSPGWRREVGMGVPGRCSGEGCDLLCPGLTCKPGE